MVIQWYLAARLSSYLEVKCVVDTNTYRTGLKADDEMMGKIDIETIGPNESWNYIIRGFK